MWTATSRSPTRSRADSKKHVTELKKALKAAGGEVVLATDYDREGEAIAYHVATLLGVDPAEAKRVTFTEITRDAILEAFRHPREIDLKLFDAQEARRVLDRLVGYKISPILWRRVRPGLSAGRVQSVAVRLIVEREREIRAFTPVEYWSIDVRLTPEGDPQPFLARLTQIPEGKLAASPDKKGITLAAEPDAHVHAQKLRSAAYRVAKVERKERKRSPAAPFTTSTLQQEAARKLGFGARKTMSIAQRLYEGVDLAGEGTVGLITYMRTDSVNLAETALREVAEVVRTEFGGEYTIAEPRRFKTRARNAQEAHEAIRPTSVLRSPARVASALDRDQLRLYTMIWQRTVASQMADARFNQVGVDIEATAEDGSRYGLRATGQTLLFDGFIRVYSEGRDDSSDEDAESRLPELTAEQVLRLLEVLPEQHFTQPPPRFTEASLVKTLEELGIGRPSTYASIISTIQDRGYVRLEDKRFFPEDVAEVVTDKLVEHFADDRGRELHRPDGGGARRDRRGGRSPGRRARASSGVRSARTSSARRRSSSATSRSSTRTAPAASRRVARRPAVCRSAWVATAGSSAARGTPRRTAGASTSATSTARCGPSPRRSTRTVPIAASRLQRKVGRFGPFVGCSGYPECRYIKRDPPTLHRHHVPAVQAGRDRREAHAVRPDVRLRPLPRVRLRGEPPARRRPPVPRVRLAPRAPSRRASGAGAAGPSSTTTFNVTKPGDPEAEAEARAAKSAARADRAAAKKKASGAKRAPKATTKRTAAKRTAAAKRTTASAKKARLRARVLDVRRRGRRAPRHPAGDAQGPRDPAELLQAARRADGQLVRGLGRVRRRDGAGGQSRRDLGRLRGRRRDGRADASGDPVRAARGSASSTGSAARR